MKKLSFSTRLVLEEYLDRSGPFPVLTPEAQREVQTFGLLGLCKTTPLDHRDVTAFAKYPGTDYTMLRIKGEWHLNPSSIDAWERYLGEFWGIMHKEQQQPTLQL
jgi:hypothetical protein